jgi:hypothetical protein
VSSTNSTTSRDATVRSGRGHSRRTLRMPGIRMGSTSLGPSRLGPPGRSSSSWRATRSDLYQELPPPSAKATTAHSAGRRRPWMSWTAADRSRRSDNDNRQANMRDRLASRGSHPTRRGRGGVPLRRELPLHRGECDLGSAVADGQQEERGHNFVRSGRSDEFFSASRGWTGRSAAR